ncbi:MAG TPA: hypothetical protein EYQ63_23625 [Fuerstia sp.]|nr:hypothetical protein [Fuerstiella sp.]
MPLARTDVPGQTARRPGAAEVSYGNVCRRRLWLPSGATVNVRCWCIYPGL